MDPKLERPHLGGDVWFDLFLAVGSHSVSLLDPGVCLPGIGFFPGQITHEMRLDRRLTFLSTSRWVTAWPGTRIIERCLSLISHDRDISYV